MNEMKFNEFEWRIGRRPPKASKRIFIIIPLWLWIQFEYFFFHVSLIRHDEISSDQNFTWNVIDMFNGIVSLNIFMRVIESLLILNTFWLRLLLTWSIQVFSDAYQNDKHLLAVSSLWFFPINFVDWFVIRLRRDGFFSFLYCEALKSIFDIIELMN